MALPGVNSDLANDEAYEKSKCRSTQTLQSASIPRFRAKSTQSPQKSAK